MFAYHILQCPFCNRDMMALGAFYHCECEFNFCTTPGMNRCSFELDDESHAVTIHRIWHDQYTVEIRKMLEFEDEVLFRITLKIDYNDLVNAICKPDISIRSIVDKTKLFSIIS